MGTGPKSVFILSVLLVAPSALAVPVHLQQQAGGGSPWGQPIGLHVGNGAAPAAGGFIYCAGCTPLTPQQLVFPVPSATGKSEPNSQQQQVIGGGGATQPSQKSIWEDGVIPVQHMSLSDDGRYSFSYNTADATRQEERNLDGSVSGSYSYTDPEGKLVQIDYTAGPQSGYKAYGDIPQPVHQLPQPVADTPEVQEARAKFLETYARELERIRQDAATATPPSTTSSSVTEASPAASELSSTVAAGSADGDTVEVSGESSAERDHPVQDDEDDAIVMSGKSEPTSAEHKSEPQDITSLKTSLENVHQPIATPPVTQVGAHGVEEDDDELDDSVVISVDNKKNAEDSSVSDSLPDPSYQITIPVGVGENAGLSIQQGNGMSVISPTDSKLRLDQPIQNQQPVAVPVQTSGANSNNIQPYFYYVSVGGIPHYIQSSLHQAGVRSTYPTSLQASLLGAIPLAAVHDAQVPSRNGEKPQQYSTAAVRPVFLDLENTVQEQQQSSTSGQNINQLPVFTPSGALSLAMNNNNNNFNSNQLFGQLVPFGVNPQGTTQLNSATQAQFGYIPALIVNVRENAGGAPQVKEGSQAGTQIPTIVFSNNVPQQQQPVQSFPALQQPLFVISKK